MDLFKAAGTAVQYIKGLMGSDSQSPSDLLVQFLIITEVRLLTSMSFLSLSVWEHGKSCSTKAN